MPQSHIALRLKLRSATLQIRFRDMSQQPGALVVRTVLVPVRNEDSLIVGYRSITLTEQEVLPDIHLGMSLEPLTPVGHVAPGTARACAKHSLKSFSSAVEQIVADWKSLRS